LIDDIDDLGVSNGLPRGGKGAEIDSEVRRHASPTNIIISQSAIEKGIDLPRI